MWMYGGSYGAATQPYCSRAMSHLWDNVLDKDAELLALLLRFVFQQVGPVKTGREN